MPLAAVYAELERVVHKDQVHHSHVLQQLPRRPAKPLMRLPKVPGIADSGCSGLVEPKIILLGRFHRTMSRVRQLNAGCNESMKANATSTFPRERRHWLRQLSSMGSANMQSDVEFHLNVASPAFYPNQQARCDRRVSTLYVGR